MYRMPSHASKGMTDDMLMITPRSCRAMLGNTAFMRNIGARTLT
jgi:hypothetical protein